MAFKKDQWTAVIVLASINLYASIGNSLQAPFYPAEAERKGASATEYGFVFGLYELTNFLTSPLAGKIMEKYELRYLASGGMMLGSTALILFGLVDQIQGRALFVIVSMILRVLEAMGTSTAAVAGFSLMASVFREDLGTIFATLETFYGAGFILGPTLGGLLFELPQRDLNRLPGDYSFNRGNSTLGGFSFPFVTVGGMGIITSISTFVLFSRIPHELPKQKEKYDVISVLKIPAVLMNLAYLAMFTVSAGFYSALLEPHLRQFNLSPSITSLFFIINGSMYAIFAPIFGKWVDRGLNPRTLILLSCISIICSFTIIGPAPFIPYEATIPSCILALIMHGLGFGSCTVATFTDAFRSTRNAGFPDTVGTFGLVSGLWNGSYALGAFLGPVIGGILYDEVGFRWATQFVSGSFIILLIVGIIFTTLTKRTESEYQAEAFNREENTPLMECLNYNEYICTSVTIEH